MTQHRGSGGFIPRDPENTQSGAHCHFLIKETAKALAGELYGVLMQDDMLYRAWKSRFPGMSAKALEQRFVAKYWGQSIPAARATLATLLRTSSDEALKETIFDALCLDATLIKGRASPASVIGSQPPTA